MDLQPKEQLVVTGQAAAAPEIGRAIWQLQECRERTMRALEQLPAALVDWVPPDAGSSIGTILYHIADIEADWLFVEVREEELPPALAAEFTHPTRDKEGKLTQVAGYSLDQHLHRLAAVRTLLLDTYQAMSRDDFYRARTFPRYDVTPEWVLHHLAQHEAEHRGQIGAVRAAAEYAGAAQ